MAYTDIDKPSDYFETVLYTGNGSSLDVSGLDFQPDWTWIKSRTTTGYQNVFDAVRGSTKRIFTNVNEAEQTVSNSLTSFNSNGFTVGSNGDLNGNSQSQVAWNWKAGTSFTNDASSTSVGTIDSVGSINTDAGFSIQTWTGTGANGTVAHGLGVTPSVMMIKRRDATADWIVYHDKNTAAPETDYLILSSTAATGDYAAHFNDTAPTSSLFTVGSDVGVNASSGTFVAYCFAEKQGYSKFGSYTGNGNVDGTFVYTGFKPAWTMIKKTSGADNWVIDDGTRSPFNLMENTLYANLSNVEYTSNLYGIDFLSNGFKIRDDDGNYNSSGGTYIYMTFASNPFTTSTGVPATAR